MSKERMTGSRKNRLNPTRHSSPALMLALLAACAGCRSAGQPSTVSVPPNQALVLAQEDVRVRPPVRVRLAGFQDQAELAPEDDEASSGGGVPEPLNAPAREHPDSPIALTAPIADLPNSPAPARPAVESTSSLSELIASALSSHPSIAAARQKVAAAQHRVPQATALDDPMLGNTFWPIHDQALQTAGGRIGHQFSLSQKVPWPVKLDARGAVAARDIQIAKAEIRRAELEIVEAVRLAYYELWLADELIRIVEDNFELVEDLIKVSQARYTTGGSRQDVLRSELEGDRLEEQLIELSRKKEQARADLGALVGQPLSLMPTALTDIGISDVMLQIEVLVAEAEACNPTLQGLAAEIARDREKEKLACLQQYPDFQLGLGYSIVNGDNNAISPVANGHDNINFSLGVTLPVWRDKIDAGIREAAHNRSATALRRDAEQDKLRGTIRRQVAEAYAAVEQLDLFRERLIPRTEQTLEIATADYQGKKADFTDLIVTYRELLSLQVQVARAKARLAGTLAQIERSVGCR